MKTKQQTSDDRRGAWIEVEGKGPAWIRSAFVDDGHTVYLPGAITAVHENQVFLCAGFDGVCIVSEKGHFYFPADWLCREFPANKDLITSAEQRCIQATCPQSPLEARMEAER